LTRHEGAVIMAPVRIGGSPCRADASRPESPRLMTPRSRRVAATLLVAILALVLAACRAVPAEESTSAGAGVPEMTEITVGVLPIGDVAAVHLAIQQGLFEAEGLTVTPEVTQGGAAAIPALQGGDLDIAYGAWPSFLIANQQGIELRAVADGVAATEGFMEFLAMPGSPLEGDASGLAGTTVALNTLGNLGELALRATLADAGLDYSQVTAVEIPFPEMGAALEGGSVDVIWTVEPGVTGSKADIGAVTVIDSFVDEMAGFPVAGYFATAEFAERNPNTVAAFTRAIEEASRMLNDDPELVVEVVQSYTEVPVDLLESAAFPEYRDSLEVSQLQRVYDYLLEFGMIEEGLDLESLVLD
jgi:NitT/TauT family transport system substrate-binding protein